MPRGIRGLNQEHIRAHIAPTNKKASDRGWCFFYAFDFVKSQ